MAEADAAAVELDGSPEDLEGAALKIQAIARGRRDRQVLKRADTAREERELAAAKVQAMQRGREGRRRAELRKEQAKAARRIQSIQRGRTARRELLVAIKGGRPLLESDVRTGLSCVGRVPDTNRHAYIHCDVTGLGLSDVDAIRGFPALQRVDIGDNQVTDLSPFSGLPSLTELYAANNTVKQMLNFASPACSQGAPDPTGDVLIGSTLQIVDLSGNEIDDMDDMERHPFLEVVNLAYNAIPRIHGLQGLRFLQSLDLTGNRLTAITGLEGLPLETLILDDNAIDEIANLDTLQNLRVLSLRNNKIRDLSHLRETGALVALDLAGNAVAEFRQLEHLMKLEFLRALTLSGNAVAAAEWYRRRVLVRLPQLAALDDEPAAPEEKVRAVNLHGGSERAVPQLRGAGGGAYENDSDLGHRAAAHDKYFAGTPFVDFLPPFQETEAPLVLPQAEQA
mmetsp:Transcript_23294/g.72869  ORF Transcript_23294/g.72869 Transcript_23294/m.72869 type:complete len:453 (-) Transcript_23294:1065-2423(-)